MKSNQNNNVIVKPFNNQQEVKNHVIDKFALHGHKVKYQFKISTLR